ncbi:MAG: hypothetical protein ABW360_04790 [Phenylobacterium sp.]
MDEVARLLLMLAFAGVVLTLLGGLVIWHMDEARRVRRGLRHVLRCDPHALLVARGRGRGVGFNFTTNRMAVAWDAGAWCLIYRVNELTGAELIVDGHVCARVHRGEARRALDLLIGADKQVRLRLVFDDPAHPDFDLDLWLAEDEAKRKAMTSAEAAEEGNRWIARTEALLRRPAPRPGVIVAAPAPAPAPASAPVAVAPPPESEIGPDLDGDAPGHDLLDMTPEQRAIH